MAGTAAACEPETAVNSNLPAGYRLVSRNGLNIVFKEGYEQSFESFLLPKITAKHDKPSGLYGRSQLTSMPLGDGSAERILVRRCVRGGILGWFFREIYLNRHIPRPLEELKVSEYARSRDVPTPQILAAAYEKVTVFFYKGAIAMREVSPSEDLQSALLAVNESAGGKTVERKRCLIPLLGRLIAKMHEAGIYHADLHLKNVLVAGEEKDPMMYLIDLDAAKVFRPLSDFRKCLNLLRLYRSAQKVNRRRRVITRADLLRFLRSYAEESSRPTSELAAKLGRMLPVWRVKWKLSDMLGV